MALLTGCASNLACSAVGCVSRLSVSTPHTVHQQRVRWMKVCVAGSCRIDDLDSRKGGPFSGGAAPTAALKGKRTASVAVTLETVNRTTLLTAGGWVRFRRVAPNGVKCGPVCYLADVTVHPDGTLTATPVGD